MSRPSLRLAPDPFVAEFTPAGALRQKVGDSGRVHIDRPLHFLVLHRSATPEQSVARRVASNSPAYLAWSPDDDLAAASALRAVVARMREHFGHVLIVSLFDQEPPSEAADDAPYLPQFRAIIGPGDDDRATCAGNALAKAMAAVEIDLRCCEVERRDRPYFEPSVAELIDSDPDLSHLSFGLPPIHRAPGGRIYPQLFRDLANASGDAVLRAACAFIADGKGNAPRHYRALGRSALLAAALSADRKLDKISRSFDFLLSVSPINTAEAMAEFVAGDGERAPRFEYRPLTADPDEAKRRLYAVDLGKLEDPLLESLLSDKRREIDQQLTMLSVRNTPAFRPASMLLYGTVDAALLADAHILLAAARPAKQGRGPMIGADAIAEAGRALIASYRAADPRFTAEVEVRDDLAAGLMVSGGKLMVSSDTRMATRRLDALLAHEVSVHLLTWFNGALQPLSIFRTGLAGYEGLQEGLGVFAEWAVGGLTATRVRLLAGRVVAVDAMLRGADFGQCYRLLADDHGFSQRTAFNVTARIYRSGGLAKDLIYLKGFKAVVDLVAAGASLDPYWLGKIAPSHAPLIEELLQRGLLHAPRFVPEFMTRADTQARIARLRGGAGLGSILEGE
ncbi:flavohemoglobin expression-modulating QEGLA motif protein [Sphingomonas sp.]|uniref:flavohemoglobin expression-modulating QEGLA motif protein n=1 Tax=Sphingomonas sp. TaxID=28214 RepID=UPI00286E8D92|nr:flavohemoglobin expression-modulating QEGLA motif protein [Sphingomonas sp.]